MDRPTGWRAGSMVRSNRYPRATGGLLRPTMLRRTDPERSDPVKRLTSVVLGLGLLAAACGAGSGSLGPAPSASPSDSLSPSVTTPSPTAPSAPSPTPSPTGRPFTFEVWFADQDVHLFVSYRTEPFVQGVARLAITALLDGP